MGASAADRAWLEKRSSAVTLSDMEVFVFPDLLYALLLANIMSPRLWRWRDDPWFDGLERMRMPKRIQRLKQFIMDHYLFNLDLETWGLTTQEKELARFRDFVDAEALRQSNALFGYEGDRYYFDIGIRTHFGLDRYTADVIPYWKTETVEAMDAFRYKPGFDRGAGECVSLAVLYAAALFVVCGLPLKDIYLMATPLHSQNFVDVGDGILTNNRRLVTKKMWFNGTALSAQARRALEHERVTVVAHESGYVHTLYPEATMDPRRYEYFVGRLRAFLRAPLDEELLGNFLRHSRELHRCFQLRCRGRGADRFVGMDRVFAYEADSSFLATDHTREALLGEMESEEFSDSPLPGRIVFNDLEAYVRERKPDLGKAEDVRRLKEQFASECLNAEIAIEGLVRFCHTEPRLPVAAEKRFRSSGSPLELTVGMDRAAVMDRVESLRETNEVADLAFHAYRDLNRVPWEPFVLAAIERCPVCIRGSEKWSDEDLVAWLRSLPEESIYDEEGRLAQPDEVWNYGRGDGVEKALLLATVLRQRHPGADIRVETDRRQTTCRWGGREEHFASGKSLRPQVWPIASAAR